MILYCLQICALSSADRVPGYEPVGREFESPRARKTKDRSCACLFVLSALVSIRLLATSLQIEFGRKPKAWELAHISVGEAHFRKEMYLTNRKAISGRAPSRVSFCFPCSWSDSTPCNFVANRVRKRGKAVVSVRGSPKRSLSFGGSRIASIRLADVLFAPQKASPRARAFTVWFLFYLLLVRFDSLQLRCK